MLTECTLSKCLHCLQPLVRKQHPADCTAFCLLLLCRQCICRPSPLLLATCQQLFSVCTIQDLAAEGWQHSLGQQAAVLAVHPGPVCAAILIKLILDLWLQNSGPVSFSLALVMLHRWAWFLTPLQDSKLCVALSCSAHLPT